MGNREQKKVRGEIKGEEGGGRSSNVCLPLHLTHGGRRELWGRIIDGSGLSNVILGKEIYGSLMF